MDYCLYVIICLLKISRDCLSIISNLPRYGGVKRIYYENEFKERFHID